MKPCVPELLPPKDINWEALIPFIGRANRELARFDGVLYGLPSPEVLLSPMTTQEAVLSSRIEGTQATLGEVLEFEAGEPATGEKQKDIVEILNYRRALLTAEEELKRRPFNLNLLLQLHEILLDSVRGRDKGRGKFRTTQNWIGTEGTPKEQAVFVPPDPLFLKEHLDHWEKYYHRQSLDAIVQLAVIHAQFEILHPFLDGNGRLGRIIIPLFLHEKGMLSRPMFYLSEWLEERREEYISHLRPLGRRDGAWNEWIKFFLTGVEQQAKKNAKRATKILDLYENLKTKIIGLTRSKYAVQLLDSLFCQPMFQATHIQFPGAHPSRVAISKLLGALHHAKIIRIIRKSSGRRAAIYEFPELLEICEARGQ